MTAAFLLLALARPFAEAGPAAGCLALAHRGQNIQAENCFARLTSAKDAWARAEGWWGLRRYREANEEFRRAVAERPRDPDRKVRWGRLLLERFNPAEAAELFQEALQIRADHAGALLGMALVAAHGFEQRAVELARRALEADPGCIEARVLLARMALEDGDAERARAEAVEALGLWQEALDAMAVLAAADWIADREPSLWVERALRIHPRYGRLYSEGARFLVLNRRYGDAVQLYRKALELDPSLSGVRSELGINLMRLGRDEEARRELERAYDEGHRDAPTVNALRLLDGAKHFVIRQDAHLVLKLHRKEAAVLEPYAREEAMRALAAFQSKYRVRLDGPVRIELYPDHEDFAVRTLGMPGLGALGVTFERAVAMDSPSARKPGSFHWVSTLWHELNHVIVLARVNNRAPRWFVEGLAVWEESQASPEWGERLTPEILVAVRERKLLPVAALDRGFVRPSYPGQVAVSYYQAGKLCEFMAREWGFQTLLRMLDAFGARQQTPQAIRQTLGLAPEELDARFLSWLEQSLRARLDGFAAWREGMKRLTEAARAGRHLEVVREGPAVRDLYPEYVEAGSAYELLATAHLALGDKAAARGELERYARAGGRDPSLLRQLALLEQEAGRAAEAIGALRRWLYVDPLNEEVHRRLGELLLEQGQVEEAIREFRVLLALGPADAAAAHYALARACHAAGRIAEAKEHVLAALETAPGFRPAQKLLLELNR
ncbi:MAG: tetratricopeptide repeat protein [Bryobacterales bacterium]|nr:tetratricopeptide repeat protein [Bryobacteraceae bacterium]MDW8129772.1 tetratricopeptide repeat protein [Bryobacterales bacterium]